MAKNCQDWGLLLTRLVIAFIFLWHGIPKAFNPSMAMSKFAAMGFPGFLGPIVGWVEVLAAIVLVVAFCKTCFKWANYILAIIIVVAILGVQLKNGVTAGLERDLLILAGNLTLAWAGPGKYAMAKK